MVCMNKVDEIREYVMEKINSSDLLSDPFDHKYVENVFPEDFYQELIRNIPEKSNYTPIVETGSVSPGYSPERFVFNLFDKKLIDTLDQQRKIFLDTLTKVLVSDKFFTSVTTQFSKAIDNRLRNFSEEEKERFGSSGFRFYFRSSLVKDFTKYNIGAHTDSIAKFVTFLFYIPSDNSLQKNGTSLYKPKIEVSHDRHFKADETEKFFEKIKTCPFVPNSVLIFPRTPVSFHGVEEINIEQKERNLLLLNYFFHKKNKS